MICRSMSSGRPHSPFEALLAVSGNIQSELPLDLAMPATLQKQQPPSPSHPSKQSTYSHDGGTMELLEDPLAERINRQADQELAAQAARAFEAQVDQWPEGVGTSGGGESGDTANSSEISKAEVCNSLEALSACFESMCSQYCCYRTMCTLCRLPPLRLLTLPTSCLLALRQTGTPGKRAARCITIPREATAGAPGPRPSRNSA